MKTVQGQYSDFSGHGVVWSNTNGSRMLIIMVMVVIVKMVWQGDGGDSYNSGGSNIRNWKF